MNKNSVSEIFASILGVPVESINDETSPENTAQWDSLSALKLALALEQAFQVRFSTKEMLSMRTVGLVRKVLRGKGITNP